MSVVSSTAGFGEVTQAAFQQLRLRQARQSAERAEQEARTLARQADQAQRVADRAQEEARGLSVQSGQAQREAGQARHGLAMLATAGAAVERLGKVAEQAVARQEAAGTRVASGSVPVVFNLSGQRTGGTVNTTA